MTTNPARSHQARAAILIAVILIGSVVALGSSPFSTKSAPAAVSPGVVASATAAVTEVQCVSQPSFGGSQTFAFGTGFHASSGIVTAAHVVAACANGAQGQASLRGGQVTVAVATYAPSHDLALILQPAGGPTLPLETRPIHVGDTVVLLGSASPQAAGLATPISGTIAATGQTVTLSAADGLSETLTDAIRISTERDGVMPGDSGGPAVDAAGGVVGVVEGGGPGVAYLTPASDVMSDLAGG